MTDKDQDPQAGSVNSETTDQQTLTPNRRSFVEPEISQPVDVLEATTFFQLSDSGPTG